MKQIIFENCSIEDKIKSIINSDKTSRKKRIVFKKKNNIYPK